MPFLQFIFLCILMSVSSLNRDHVILLKCNRTTVVGSKEWSVLEDKPYASFWKIPYAVPPIKKLRFKPPKEDEGWYNDTSYDYSRPYKETCTSGRCEDCLYLSVHMPLKKKNEGAFPTIVWVHEMSNEHGPDFFIEQKVIVVTVSYRTSVFGFLNTEDDFAKGNMGAKDLVLALKWVKKHIAFFNGDPDNVTVMGAGPSATIVASLVLTGAADEIVKRVIIQSGSALSPADYSNDNFEVAKKLYSNLNGPYEEFDIAELYKVLSKSTTKELLLASKDLFDSSEVRDNQRLINSFSPTVEIRAKNAFMSKTPLEVYKRRMTNNNIEVMMGYTSLESLYKLSGFVKNKKLLKYLNCNFQYLLPFEGTKNEFGSKRYTKIMRKIMDFYFVNGTIEEQSMRRYAKYVSDQVIYPIIRQAKLHAEASCKDVYLYRFSYKGAMNNAWDYYIPSLNLPGATFGDDTCYLFKCKSLQDVYDSPETADEKDFIRKFTKLFANFAKYGNPTPDEKDEILGELKWKPLQGNNRLRGLNLGAKIKMVKLHEEKRVEFWDKLKRDFFTEKVLRKELR